MNWDERDKWLAGEVKECVAAPDSRAVFIQGRGHSAEFLGREHTRASGRTRQKRVNVWER